MTQTTTPPKFQAERLPIAKCPACWCQPKDAPFKGRIKGFVQKYAYGKWMWVRCVGCNPEGK